MILQKLIALRGWCLSRHLSRRQIVAENFVSIEIKDDAMPVQELNIDCCHAG
jgi:hypothetical protein